MINFPNPWIWIDYLSISIGSFVTNNRFSPFIGLQSIVQEEPAISQMHQLSLKENQLKLGTLGELPIILEEYVEYTSNE